MKVTGIGAYILLIAVLIFALGEVSFAGLRCGTELVHEGESKAEIIHKCGEPSFVESWGEERIQRDYYHGPIFSTRTRGYHWYSEPFLVKELVRIEEWTYNFGSTRFIRFLRFENGILKEMAVGNYGF
jgi:hypothetical protein